MNWVDIIVIVIVAISGLLALSIGFIKEILWLAAWVIAVIVAIYTGPEISAWVEGYIERELIAQLVGWGGVFLVTLVILMIFVHLIGKAIVPNSPTAVDRWLGLVFGLVRGWVIVCLLYMLTLWAFPGQEGRYFLENSFTKPYLDMGVDFVRSLIPLDQPTNP